MHIPVLIEPLAEQRFRARSGEPLMLTAEGATREEALRNIETQIRERVAAGAELVSLDVGPAEHPWARFAGTLDDNDPLVQEWLQIMAERRRADDEREFGPA